MLHKVKFAVLCVALFALALIFTSAQAQTGGVRRAAGTTAPFSGNAADDGVFLANVHDELQARWQADAAAARQRGVAVRGLSTTAPGRKAGLAAALPNTGDFHP